MKYILLFVISINVSVCIGQTDTAKTIYKGLKTKKFYSVGTQMTTEGGQTTYYVDGKSVSNQEYKKYADTWKNMETCTPCILESYEENGKLSRKAVQYTDCLVGQYIEYYSNGKVKIIGHYKENDTGNWENLYDRGYCSEKHGLWTYYSIKGEVEKTETYVDNELVK